MLPSHTPPSAIQPYTLTLVLSSLTLAPMECSAPDCTETIHEKRLEAIPWAKTCSPTCTKKRHMAQNRQSAARHRERVRESKAGLKPTVVEQATRGPVS